MDRLTEPCCGAPQRPGHASGLDLSREPRQGSKRPDLRERVSASRYTLERQLAHWRSLFRHASSSADPDAASSSAPD
jgi:hypothetical protein